MNPFTESTVAQPESEAWTHSGDDAKRPPPNQASGNVSPGQVATKARPMRRPRPERLVRRRTRGQVVRRTTLNGWLKQSYQWPALCAVALTCMVSTAWAVNVNSATALQLESITGIGPKTAQVIIDERTRGGSFESFDDLAERVKGIGPKKARSLQAAGLTVGQSASDEAKPAAPTGRRASR